MRLARELRSLSQTELAERVGLTQSTISRLERGQTGCEPAVVGQVAAAFGLQGRVFDQLREEAEERTARAVTATLPDASTDAWWEAALKQVGFLGMAGLIIYVVSGLLAEQDRHQPSTPSRGRAPRVHGRTAHPGPRAV